MLRQPYSLGIYERRGAAAGGARGSHRVESDDVANYCFPKEWPANRDQHADVIAEWLQTEARFLGGHGLVDACTPLAPWPKGGLREKATVRCPLSAKSRHQPTVLTPSDAEALR
jgi:hypothetical protein